MALKKTLTKAEFEALPEATRTFYQNEKVYVPDGENWKLDAEGVEDVSGLKSALDKERKAAADAQKALKAEQDRLAGVDVDEYKRLKAEADSKETDELKSKGKIDEIIEKHKKALEDQKKAYEEKLATANSELDRVTIDGALRTAFVDAGVLTDRIEDAVQLTKSRAKRENGKLVLLDEDGSPLDVSLENYAKEVLKEKKPWLFAATGAGGSGAPPGTGGQPGSKIIKRADFDKLPPLQQSAAMKEVREGKAQLQD